MHNENLNNVDFSKIKSFKDFDNIPNGCECYWIWTNEPVISPKGEGVFHQ